MLLANAPVPTCLDSPAYIHLVPHPQPLTQPSIPNHRPLLDPTPKSHPPRVVLWQRFKVFRLKDVRPVAATRHHMIDRSGIFDAWFPHHVVIVAPHNLTRQSLNVRMCGPASYFTDTASTGVLAPIHDAQSFHVMPTEGLP